MYIASSVVFLLSLVSFLLVLAGIVAYFTKQSPKSPVLKKVSEGAIAVFFIYILYREVFEILNLKRYFIYETELFAYFGLLGWLYLLQKNTHRTAYRLIILGLAILAVVYISFYSIVFIEKYFNLCGIIYRCK